MNKKRPTQKTMEVLRKEGAIVGIVERYNHFIKIRQDLFGFLDLVALKDNKIIGIQCCAGSGHAAHKKKILENKIAPIWLKTGATIEIRSWSKRKVLLKNGNKTDRWIERIEEIYFSLFK